MTMMDLTIILCVFGLIAFLYFAGLGIWSLLSGKITWDEFWNK